MPERSATLLGVPIREDASLLPGTWYMEATGKKLDRRPLKCSRCGLPYAHVENGVLIVTARHHGEKHECVIAVSELVKIMQGAGGPVISPGLVGYHDVEQFYVEEGDGNVAPKGECAHDRESDQVGRD